jgi:hypothetical protein
MEIICSAIAMSALPPKADMCIALAYVCFGPGADIGPDFYDERKPAVRRSPQHRQVLSISTAICLRFRRRAIVTPTTRKKAEESSGREIS